MDPARKTIEYFEGPHSGQIGTPNVPLGNIHITKVVAVAEAPSFDKKFEDTCFRIDTTSRIYYLLAVKYAAI